MLTNCIPPQTGMPVDVTHCPKLQPLVILSFVQGLYNSLKIAYELSVTKVT